eukprot:15335851-Ditylum_brightwellii.AAC.1
MGNTYNAGNGMSDSFVGLWYKDFLPGRHMNKYTSTYFHFSDMNCVEDFLAAINLKPGGNSDSGICLQLC